MATTYITGFQTTAATLNGFDQLFVQGRINGTSLATAIDVSGTNNDVFVDGFVNNSNGRGVLIEGSTNNLTVTDTGRIAQASTFGGSAVYLNDGTGGHVVTNYGQIMGNYAIATGGTSNSNIIYNYGSMVSTEATFGIGGVTIGSDFNKVTNVGSITGGTAGIYVNSGADGGKVFNYGDIVGRVGIQSSGDNMETVNYGTISGTDGSSISDFGINNVINNFGTLVGNLVANNSTTITITNEGTISGSVTMGTGNDSYVARGAGHATGTISAGDGEDTVIGGSGEDILRGDGQGDLMRGRAGDDDIDGGGGNDVINGQKGDDLILGNVGADILKGGADDDVIKAGSGKDIIHGGRGNDVMTGGGADDIFVFNRRSGDDEITDFNNNNDQLDLSRLDVVNRADMVAKGALASDGGSGSIIDLTKLGGDGVIYVEDMTFADWNNADFIF